MSVKPALFPDSPTVTFYDPLGEMLGAGDGYYEYSFDDVVKLAGHACPTVAGAFVMTLHAVAELYGAQTPVRGDIRVELAASPDTGSTGPFSQVFTLLTGAAADNGFHGLSGNFVRHGLLVFNPDSGEGPITVTFRRISNNTEVTLSYNPSAIAPDPQITELMKAIMAGAADQKIVQRFRTLWRDRVDRILSDRGNSTIQAM